MRHAILAGVLVAGVLAVAAVGGFRPPRPPAADIGAVLAEWAYPPSGGTIVQPIIDGGDARESIHSPEIGLVTGTTPAPFDAVWRHYAARCGSSWDRDRYPNAIATECRAGRDGTASLVHDLPHRRRPHATRLVYQTPEYVVTVVLYPSVDDADGRTPVVRWSVTASSR